MAANGQLVFTDVDKVTFKGVGDTSNAVIDTTTGKIGVGVDSPDANLHVLGNCFVSTNFELGGTMTMGTVTVRAQHELSAITATGNTTPHTVEFQNAETGLVTTGNVSVGKELTVTGNVAVDTDTLFVDSVNDRVGVGTTNPDCRLHVEEPADISATTRLFHTENGFSGGSVGHFEIVEKKTGTGTGWSDFTLRLQRRVDVTEQGYIEFNPTGSTGDYGIAFGTGATETMRIDALNGNVGIGTTNPDTKLEVKFPSNDGSQPILSLIRDGTMSSTVGATFRAIDIKTQQTGYSPVTHASINLVNYNPSGTGQFGLSQPGRQDTGFGFSVIHDGSTVENALVISSIGNVGIGTTSPDDKLHLYGATDSTLRVETDTGQAQLLLRSGASTRRACRIDFSRADTGTQYMQLIGDYQQNGTDDLTVATSTSGRIMTWLQNGNVGIGTTSPNWPLEVSAGNDSITYYGPNSSWSSYLAVGAANDKTIANNTAIAQCITTNGNLHLDAAATRSMYLNHYSGNAVYYQSTVIHGSDDRLKSEEELITNATDTLLKLNPQKYKKAYTLREDESREPFTESGLMAQDVWYDAPELRHLVHLGADANPVDTKPEAPVDGDIQQDPDYSSWGTETAALNYDGLIAYLIKSNQELHARIQALENA